MTNRVFTRHLRRVGDPQSNGSIRDRKRRVFTFLAVVLAIGLCGRLVGPVVASRVYQDDDDVEQSASASGSPSLPVDNLPEHLNWTEMPLGMPSTIAMPEGASMTEEIVALGRKLFFDPILSRDQSVSCASCHRPENAFATNDPVAIGIGGAVGTRNAPSLLNVAFGTSFFWDGRAVSLEDQALQPIENPIEMDFTVDGALERLRNSDEYRSEFSKAFQDGITRDNLASALASFQRALITGNSPVDRFRAADFSALSDEARRGMWIFESRGGCWRCHGGPNFNDEAFHNTGVSWNPESGDTGKHQLTGDEKDLGLFKTPTLRLVAHTAPYMHDGSINTLREVVEFYNKGGGKNPNLDPVIKPLNLSEEEMDYLVAFLEALSSDAPGMPPSESDQEEAATDE